MNNIKAFILILIWLLASCHHSQSMIVTIEGYQFICEVAMSDESRARGLMHRQSLAANRGMLFVFESDQLLSFWMKDTPIPLAIAYIDRNGYIRDIIEMEPYSLASVKSSVPVRYALELKGETFDRLGIKVGSRVSIEGIEL